MEATLEGATEVFLEGALEVSNLEGAVTQAMGRMHTEGTPMGPGTRADDGGPRM